MRLTWVAYRRPYAHLIVTTLSLDQARRIALAAQGFDRPRPLGRIDIRHLRRAIRTMNLLQIDSVNVAVRSHYMPLFSRLGPYPMALLDDMAYRRRELFEYWGHVASLLPIEDYPLFRWRMNHATVWRSISKIEQEHPGYLDGILEEIRHRGPSAVSDLDDPGERTGPWWGYGKGKEALEWHFTNGALTVADRRNFARVYELAERWVPSAIYNAPMPTREEAQRRLLERGARAHGVGTGKDIADYYRIRMPEARPRLAELVEQGVLEKVEVEGWNRPAYLHRDATAPRRISARALLTPFDPVVWERDRVERLFGFHYRIEIYVPEPQRQYGYYVMPFLLGDRLVARVDLKADRKAGVLRVPGAYHEDGVDVPTVAAELADELGTMASWLGLTGVVVAGNGNLARSLRGALPS